MRDKATSFYKFLPMFTVLKSSWALYGLRIQENDLVISSKNINRLYSITL